MPLSTSRPAAVARSVAGSSPRPAATTSASIVLPEPVVTQVAPAAATVSSVSTSTPRPRYSVGHKGRQLRRQHARCDPALREDHRHPAAVRCQRRRELRPDEAAADHDRARALVHPRPHGPVVVERSEVDDAVGARDCARAAAGREQQLLPAVLLAAVVPRAVTVEVERDDATAEPQHRSRLLRPAPDLRLVRPAHRPFVSGGRAYGGCCSAPTRTIEPSASCSRIPLTAASPVIPPPTIR